MNLNNSDTQYVFNKKDGKPRFYQYGNSNGETGQYGVTCTVSRGSALRAASPTILAVVTSDSGAVTVKVELENTDETEFEIVVPRSTTSITYQVMDIDGFTNWIASTARSEEGKSLNADIVREGAFATLVDEALSAKNSGGTWTKWVSEQLFKDAGYTKVNSGNVANAKAALVAATTNTALDRAGADAALSSYK